MQWSILADCLWNWGGIVLALCIVHKLTEYDCKIDTEDYWQKREEDGI